MIPVHCRVKHDPENGKYGDCVRACIASILELDAEKVPHFYDAGRTGEEAIPLIRDWLATMDLAAFFSSYPGEIPLDDLLAFQEAQNPQCIYMLFGSTVSGDHVAIYEGGKFIHDAAWYRLPLIGPPSNGMWSIMVIAVQ